MYQTLVLYCDQWLLVVEVKVCGRPPCSDNLLRCWTSPLWLFVLTRGRRCTWRSLSQSSGAMLSSSRIALVVEVSAQNAPCQSWLNSRLAATCLHLYFWGYNEASIPRGPWSSYARCWGTRGRAQNRWICRKIGSCRKPLNLLKLCATSHPL